jgi:hypothetical protein
VGQLGRLDRFDHGGVELLGAGTTGDVLDQKDLAGQHLALPGLIADLFFFQNQFTLVADVDQRHLGRLLDVVSQPGLAAAPE